MNALLGYRVLAFWAGLLLNFVPCVLPVIPVKIRIVLRELKGDIRSRVLAAISLLSGTVGFFLLLGAATAYLEIARGDLFRSKWFLAGLAIFFLFTGIATFANWSFRIPAVLHRIPISRYTGAAVIQAAKNAKLTLMRVDMTNFNDSHRRLLEKYGGTALPFAVLMDGAGKVHSRLQGMFTAKTLETAINRLMKNSERSGVIT